MTQPLGSVYDRGYKPYTGPRGGRGAATRALYLATLRRALGVRRPWQRKVVPLGLLVLSLLPAVVDAVVAFVARGAADPPAGISHRDYVGVSSGLLLFVAVMAPEVVCPDRRHRVLQLLFARPLTGLDYAAAKVGAIFTCVFAFSLAPHVLIYGTRLLVSDDWTAYVSRNAAVLWQVPLAVTALAAFYAMVGVAAASLTDRRVVAAAGLLGASLVGGIVSKSLLSSVDPGTGASAAAALVDAAGLPLMVREVVFLGDLSNVPGMRDVAGANVLALAAYVLVVAAAGVILLLGYRRGAS